jgi:hypothetical protein
MVLTDSGSCPARALRSTSAKGTSARPAVGNGSILWPKWSSEWLMPSEPPWLVRLRPLLDSLRCPLALTTPMTTMTTIYHRPACTRPLLQLQHALCHGVARPAPFIAQQGPPLTLFVPNPCILSVLCRSSLIKLFAIALLVLCSRC